MLCDVSKQIPYAMTLVDVTMPGLPMAYCNPAMVELTGYTKEQLHGRNCRMLQGKGTEAGAVHQLVEAIRLSLIHI